MSTWNYRIIQFADHAALHEVYYDAEGNPKAYTAEPATFVCDRGHEAEIAGGLEMALKDAKDRPVLEASVFAS